MFGVKRCTGTSPKQILWKINSALYSKQLAEQSGSSVLQLDFGWSNRTACYHNVTEFDPGWFSRTENCTSQFTDKFGIITEVFRALSKLDPESLYLTWPKQCIWTHKSRIFRTQQKDKPRRKPNVWSKHAFLYSKELAEKRLKCLQFWKATELQIHPESKFCELEKQCKLTKAAWNTTERQTQKETECLE